MATYTLTPAQQTSLTNAFNMGPQNLGDPGTHIEFYIELANILSTDNGSGSPDQDQQILPIRIWAQGASKTNSNKGVFSTLIREYTHEQGVLHWQRRFTDESIPGQVSEMQEASNQIARNAFRDMRDNTGWQVQSISRIANVDAVGVGEVLFDCPAGVSDCASVVGDSITSDSDSGGNNAAWSGVPFFSSFDDRTGEFPADETYRLLGPIDNATLDTLDDFRNVLYSHHSFNYAVQEAVINGGTLILNLEELGELAIDVRTFFEVCMFSGRCGSTFATTVRGQVAEEAAQPSLLYGVTDTVNLIKSGAEGVVNETKFRVDLSQISNTSFSTNFRDQARDLFGAPGPQNQNIPASFERVGDLISQAQGGDNVAQKALQGLSPFKIDNGTTVSLVASDQYWADRGLMTTARLLFDGQGVLYVGSVTSSGFIDPVQFNDVTSGISLEVDNNILPFSNFRQIKFGSESADTLSGGDYKDSLYGLGGADSLDGGPGNDFLSGGNGNDSYSVDAGRDIIFDADGNGSVEFNGEILIGGDRLSANVWISTDNRFKFQQISAATGEQLIITDADNPDDLITINQFSDGNLGITLNNSDDATSEIDNFAPADETPVGRWDYYSSSSPNNDLFDSGNSSDMVFANAGDDLILLGNGTDRVLAGLGNDTIFGEAGSDYIVAGLGFDNLNNGPNDKDTVYGGGDTDLINTGVGDDVLHAGDAGDDISAAGSIDIGDLLVADEGNDVIYGSVNQDFITAGSGADIVYGGGGFDIILGDGHYGFFVPINTITDIDNGLAKEHVWNGSDWDTTTITFALVTPGNAFDFTVGVQANGDFDFTSERLTGTLERIQDSPATLNDDTIYAGADSDWVAGGMGNDFINGESGDDIIYGDDIASQPLPNASDYGNDFINGGSGDDLLYGNAGDDIIYGGTGNDMIFGDDQGHTSGDDRLFGNDGVDELYGYGGNDYLSGGAGDDVVLVGGTGDDVIDGNQGNDVLSGDAGNDNLRGGAGDDQLNAGNGNDFLFGGAGDDVLNGDAGDDVFSGGQGVDQLNGGAGNDVYLAVLNHSGATSPDVITDTAGTDRIKFDELVYASRITFEDVGSDLLVHYSPNDALRIAGGAGGSVVEEYEFFDGRILSYTDLKTVPKVAKTSNTLMASTNEITAFNDWYEGDDTVQNLDMLAGDDAVIARGGNDSINGGAGKDVLDGGAGNDTLNGGADNDRLFGATGNDSLNGDDGDDLLAGGDGIDTLSGGNGVDILRGGRDDDNLFGNAGDDFIQGDRGADTLAGDSGYDTYIFKYQDDPAPGVTPITTIVDSDDAGGNAIKFLGGLNADDIILINDRNTGDLEIQYGHHENTILSSIHVANSADGEVISEFQFSDGTIVSFEALCISQPSTCEVADLIFTNGFEQVVTKTTTIIANNKDAIVNDNQIGASAIDSSASLPLLIALLSQVFK